MARKFLNLHTRNRLPKVRKAAIWMTNRDKAKLYHPVVPIGPPGDPIQWVFVDGKALFQDPVTFFWHFEDQIGDQTREVQLGRYLEISGNSLSFDDLTGIEIASSEGTSTPTKSGNDVLLTNGTLERLVLDNGSILNFEEAFAGSLYAKCFDSTDNGLDAVINGLITSTTRKESIQVSSDQNLIGYNKEVADGNELVTNGDFSTDTDWVKGVGTVIEDGVAKLNGATINSLYQQIGLDDGFKYRITFDVVSVDSGEVTVWAGGSQSQTSNPSFNTVGTKTVIMDLTETTLTNGNIIFGGINPSFTGSIDNVSTELCIPFVQTLNTPENLALPFEQQVDVLGNPLEFYGRVKYNRQATKSQILNFTAPVSFQFTDLTGVDISSFIGTSTPTKNGNNIDFTVGTYLYMELDNGSKLPPIGGSGSIVRDSSGNAFDATMTSSTVWDVSDIQYPYFFVLGGNESAGFRTVADENNPGFDVDGVAIQSTGSEYYAKVLGETLLKQPNAPELYAVEKNHTDNLWYGGGETAIDYAPSLIEVNRQAVGQNFADLSELNTVINELVYSEPQVEPTLGSIYDFINSPFGRFYPYWGLNSFGYYNAENSSGNTVYTDGNGDAYQSAMANIAVNDLGLNMSQPSIPEMYNVAEDTNGERILVAWPGQGARNLQSNVVPDITGKSWAMCFNYYKYDENDTDTGTNIAFVSGTEAGANATRLQQRTKTQLDRANLRDSADNIVRCNIVGTDAMTSAQTVVVFRQALNGQVGVTTYGQDGTKTETTLSTGDYAPFFRQLIMGSGTEKPNAWKKVEIIDFIPTDTEALAWINYHKDEWNIPVTMKDTEGNVMKDTEGNILKEIL